MNSLLKLTWVSRGTNVFPLYLYPTNTPTLFEPTELEQSTIVISNLRSENIEIFAGTVLKDSQESGVRIREWKIWEDKLMNTLAFSN